MLVLPSVGLWKPPDTGDGWVNSGAVWRVDAENPASYPLADTSLWYNVIAAPADGETNPDSWARQGTGDGPTFTSTPPKYFDTDGAKYFRLFRHGTFADTLHKDNAAFTLVALLYHASSGGNGLYLYGSTNGSLDVGTRLYISGNTLNFAVTNGAGTAVNVNHGTSVSTSAWHFAAVSVDEASGSGYIVLDDTADGFAATYASPSSAAASRTANIFAAGGGNFPSPTSNRIAVHGAWNRALTTTEIAQCFAAIRSRYGI